MRTLFRYGHYCVTFDQYKDNMLGLIFDGRLTTIDNVKNMPNIYLHPTKPTDGFEIFAIEGTEENYKVFLKNEIRGFCTLKAFDKIGYPTSADDPKWDILHEMIETLITNFKPWYETL